MSSQNEKARYHVTMLNGPDHKIQKRKEKTTYSKTRETLNFSMTDNLKHKAILI